MSKEVIESFRIWIGSELGEFECCVVVQLVQVLHDIIASDYCTSIRILTLDGLKRTYTYSTTGSTMIQCSAVSTHTPGLARPF